MPRPRTAVHRIRKGGSKALTAALAVSGSAAIAVWILAFWRIF